MAWIQSRPRLEQVYCFTVAALNDCGIRPDGAVIKAWIRDQFGSIEPQPAKEECETVLVGLVTTGAKLQGDAGSSEKFAAHPLFQGSVIVPVGNV